MHRAHAALERRFPERRLFLKSDDHTRFIRLKPETQLAAWVGTGAVVSWSIVATAILLLDTVGSGNYREQALRDKTVYEDRMETLAAERDMRAGEALAAQERFALALDQVSAMQSELLASEERRRELERGLEVVHATLRDVMQEREDAQDRLAVLVTAEARAPAFEAQEMGETLDFLTRALADAAAERDGLQATAEEAVQMAGDLDLELRLMEERNDEIFQQLEEAMEISVEPLDEMFRTAGLDPDELIEEVRRGYSGTGGPMTPIQFSTSGSSSSTDATHRANSILDELDRLNVYRIAVERVPFAQPVRDSFRFTSGFGPRWGRMHEGTDFAAPIGTPVYAPADGEVSFAGWASGYGRLIKVRHANGIETRYGHLNAIRVEVGQRVSRGEGSVIWAIRTLHRAPSHYEIRVGGEPLNPMIYIGAGDDVL
jgi:hypothetical protein